MRRGAGRFARGRSCRSTRPGVPARSIRPLHGSPFCGQCYQGLLELARAFEHGVKARSSTHEQRPPGAIGANERTTLRRPQLAAVEAPARPGVAGQLHPVQEPQQLVSSKGDVVFARLPVMQSALCDVKKLRAARQIKP